MYYQVEFMLYEFTLRIGDQEWGGTSEEDIGGNRTNLSGIYVPILVSQDVDRTDPSLGSSR